MPTDTGKDRSINPIGASCTSGGGGVEARKVFYGAHDRQFAFFRTRISTATKGMRMQIYAEVDAETHDKIAAKFSGAIAAFEKNFVVGPDWDGKNLVSERALASTGEPYVEVTEGGLRPVGEETPHVDDFKTGTRVKGLVIHHTFESAIDAWSEYVKGMIPSSPATLYWRIRPEIHQFLMPIEAKNGTFLIPTWKIYSRFLISDK